MAKAKSNNKDIITLAIAIVVGIILKLILPVTEGGLTPEGTTLLSVFVPTIILWVVIGTGWPTYLSLTALVVFGAMGNGAVYSTMWGNGVSVAVISLAMISFCMKKSGAMDYIAKWFLSRPVVHGRPMIFLLMLCLTIWILGVGISPTIICVLMCALIGEICASCGYTKDEKWYRGMILMTLWVSTVMDGVFPFGRPLVLALLSMMQGLGFENFTALLWLKMSVPFGILLTLAAILIVIFVYKPDLTKFKAFDDVGMREELKKHPMTKAGVISSLAMLFNIVAWILPHLKLGAFSAYMSTWGTATCTCLMIVLLCVARGDDKKPVLDLAEGLKNVPWMLIVFLGGVMFYASYFGSDTFGIKAALVTLMGPVAQTMSPVVAALVGVVIVGVATQFMSNTVSGSVIATVFVTVLMGFAGVSNGLLFAFTVAIGLIANCSYCTFAAAPSVGAAINEDTIPYSCSVKLSVTMVAIAMAMLFVLVPVFQNIL